MVGNLRAHVRANMIGCLAHPESAARRRARPMLVLLICAAVLIVGSLASSATASAADSIYWSADKAIRVGNLVGGTPADLFPASGPNGVAIDPAAGKIYWANGGTNKIRVGNLNGSGTPADLFPTTIESSSPYGVAIDPAAGKIYWTNYKSGKLRVGYLNGSGTPGDLFPTTTESGPVGVTIDRAAGKIYWADEKLPGKIRVGNLNGSGTPADLFPTTSESAPEGVAIDPRGNKIYWANFMSGKIRVGNLDGSGTPADLFPTTTESGPYGVAIDPAAKKIYWTNYDSGRIRVGNLNGSGTPIDLFFPESGPAFLALLRAPLALAAPTVSGGPRVGSSLSCTRGRWAGDLLGAFLYRAPRTFAYQWVRDGANIAGATGSRYKATKVGRYLCRVSAANAAGISPKTSASHPVKPPKPTVTKRKIDHLNASARFSFRANGTSSFACAIVTRGTNGTKLPEPKFSACKSPRTYKRLKRGKYVFEVRGRSSAGPGPVAKKGFTI